MDAVRSLIIPVDFSEASDAALSRGLDLAARLKLPLHILHAVQPTVLIAPGGVGLPVDVWQAITSSAQERLDSLVAGLPETPVEVTSAMLEGITVDVLEAAVAERDRPLVVMGTHGHGAVERFLLGSTTERSLRRLTCPVLVVKDGGDPSTSIAKILFATDFSKPAVRAGALASELALALGASVAVVHVLQGADEAFRSYGVAPAMEQQAKLREMARTRLDESVARFRDAGVTAEGYVAEGEAATTLASEQERLDAGLLVMATRGQTGLAHLILGSVAERTLRVAKGPVLVDPASD